MERKVVITVLIIITAYIITMTITFNKYINTNNWQFKQIDSGKIVFSSNLNGGIEKILKETNSLLIKGYVYDPKIELFSKRPSSRIVLLNTNTGIYYALDTQILPAEDDNGSDKYKVSNNRYRWVSATVPLSYLSKYKGTYRVLLNYAVDDISLFAATSNYIRN